VECRQTTRATNSPKGTPNEPSTTWEGIPYTLYYLQAEATLDHTNDEHFVNLLTSPATNLAAPSDPNIIACIYIHGGCGTLTRQTRCMLETIYQATYRELMSKND
jgi:hypothetical protein